MKLLFIFLSFTILFSCTITKRHFEPGYYVEWKYSSASKKLDANHLVVDSNRMVEIKSAEQSKILQSNLNASASNPIEERIFIEQNAANPVNSRTDQLTDSDKVITSDEEDYISRHAQGQKEEDPQRASKKMQKNTWISLFFLLLLGIMAAIFSISGFLLTVGAGAVLFALALGMFITSLIAVIRIMRNPDRYKNRALSFTLFFFSCTFLFVGLVFFLAVGLSEINFF